MSCGVGEQLFLKMLRKLMYLIKHDVGLHKGVKFAGKKQNEKYYTCCLRKHWNCYIHVLIEWSPPDYSLDCGRYLEWNDGSAVSGGMGDAVNGEDCRGSALVQQEQNPVLVDTQDSLHQMDNLTSDAMTLNGYYGTQQNVQGLQVQLNLMEPPHDGYYVNQHSMQGLGPLNSMAPSHDGFFGTQQSIHGMGGGQLEYRPTTTFGYSLQDEPDPHFHSNNTRNT
ncbi:hypothetical protein RYX36_021197 [Vicia faba]